VVLLVSNTGAGEHKRVYGVSRPDAGGGHSPDHMRAGRSFFSGPLAAVPCAPSPHPERASAIDLAFPYSARAVKDAFSRSAVYRLDILPNLDGVGGALCRNA